MPFSIQTLSSVRQQSRQWISSIVGVPLLPNDIPRVLADANAGLAHLCLQFIQWLANNLLPDTATAEWLDKWGDIYLVDSDGSGGRKAASYSSGTALVTAKVAGTVLPAGTQFAANNGTLQILFASKTAVTISTSPTPVAIRALTAGIAGNLEAGTGLRFASAIPPGLDAGATKVIELDDGADQEGDDDLRARILSRIRNPPMSGDAKDYEAWALSVPGVTRAWCSPNEMGPGTVTLRIMCDQTRATSDPMTSGQPTSDDIAAVRAYIDTVRPVTVADYWVFGPIPVAVDCTITNLSGSNISTEAAINQAIASMILKRARPAQAINGRTQPAQTIFRAWVSDAILGATGVTSFDVAMDDFVPPNKGSIAVMGSVRYV